MAQWLCVLTIYCVRYPEQKGENPANSALHNSTYSNVQSSSFGYGTMEACEAPVRKVEWPAHPLTMNLTSGSDTQEEDILHSPELF
jgi:hypothetical protein